MERRRLALACTVERERTGVGQVIDAAMIDGAALMLTPFFSARASGFWGPRGTNLLDTGAPFYEVYETADGQWMAVGAIEPQFYAAFVAGLGLDLNTLADRDDPANWSALKSAFAAVFHQRTRAQWCHIFDGTDACVAPVMSPTEAHTHPHNVARRGFLVRDGVPQPAPGPRFSTHPDPEPAPPEHPGADTAAVLAEWGVNGDDVAALQSAGVLV